MVESWLKRRKEKGLKKPFSHPYKPNMSTKTASEGPIKAFLLLEFYSLTSIPNGVPSTKTEC